jgi:dihydroorotase
MVIPGAVDVHVHLRHPGGSHKETPETGTAAALAGGVVAILAMPNTLPPLATPADLRASLDQIATRIRCDVGAYYGATDTNADMIAEQNAIACGLKIYLNDTYGPLRLETLAAAAQHFSAWPASRPLVVHAEGLMTAAAIGLAAAHRRPVHIAHVSRREEIELIAAAKEAGLPVTCEVTPHHLWLTHADGIALGGYGEVRPALASAADRDALWSHLNVVDCIATDHAPHSREEKEDVSPPPGMPGLETSLPLLFTAVADGRLTADRAVELLSTTPARLFRIPTPAHSEVRLELGGPWSVPDSGFQTRADWSPFAGMAVRARVVSTTLRGQSHGMARKSSLRREPGTF